LYKIVLIDDEPWVLKGIQAMLDWEAYNCEVVGAFTDPNEAKKFMESHHPDIAFVDINLGEVSGLDLIKSIKETIDIEVIIVSGYSSFDYAKEALKYGVIDYILKPIDKQELKDILNKLLLALRRKPKFNELVRIFDQLDLSENECSLDYFGEADYKGYQVLISEDKNLYFDGSAYLMHKLSDHKYIYFMTLDEPIEEMSHQCNSSIGISTFSKDVHELTKLSYEADIAFLTQELYKTHSMVKYVDNTELVINHLFNFSSVDKRQWIERLENLLTYHKLSVYDLCHIYNMVQQHLSYLYINNVHEQLSYYQFFDLFETFEDFVSMLKDLLLSSNNPSDYDIESNIGKIMYYIDMNFATDINLQILSKIFNYAPSYISQLFKRHNSLTFIEYLTMVRIENSKSLLLTTDMRIMEISGHVGFSDYSYYSKIFKKHLGLTPREYRKRGMDG